MGRLTIAAAIVKSGSLVLPSEIEEQINELETRVDRLRALYEQYFMGIEKMEPQVAKKDVDRRIQSIRREQIRNTALRFRFQMIIQRYNTYQTHWLRICREIEEGTYKRHLLRAGQKFGEAAERLLPKWHRKRTRWSKAGAAEQGADPAAVAGAAASPGAGAMDFDDIQVEEALESVIVGPQPPELSKGPPRVPPPLPARSPAVLVPAAKPLAPVPSAAMRDHAAATPASPANSVASSKPVVPTPANAFRPPGAGPQIVPTPANAFRPGSAAAAEGDATKEERMRDLARRLNDKRAASAGGGAPTAAQAQRPAPAAAPAAAAPAPAAAAPAPAPQAQRPAPVAAAPTPAPARPAPARPAPAPPPPSTPNPSPRPQRDLSEERMRQLYSELVETKRKQKESTAALTYEGMARRLHESSAKLKEKHNGRSVDFEVTIKDGKTILRPVVK